jgi:hypothetical protein
MFFNSLSIILNSESPVINSAFWGLANAAANASQPLESESSVIIKIVNSTLSFVIDRKFTSRRRTYAALFPSASRGSRTNDTAVASPRHDVERKGFRMALISQPLTGKPLAEFPELDELRQDFARNVPTWDELGRSRSERV